MDTTRTLQLQTPDGQERGMGQGPRRTRQPASAPVGARRAIPLVATIALLCVLAWGFLVSVGAQAAVPQDARTLVSAVMPRA